MFHGVFTHCWSPLRSDVALCSIGWLQLRIILSVLALFIMCRFCKTQRYSNHEVGMSVSAVAFAVRIPVFAGMTVENAGMTA